MNITKDDCDAVRDIAIGALEVWDTVLLTVHLQQGHDYPLENKQILESCANRAEGLLQSWRVAWRPEVQDWFEASNPVRRDSDFVTASETATRSGCAGAIVIRQMLSDGWSTPSDLKSFAKTLKLRRADIRLEWVAALRGLKLERPSDPSEVTPAARRPKGVRRQQSDKLPVLRAVFQHQHWPEGEFCSELLTHKSILAMISKGAPKPPRGWSPTSLTHLLQMLFGSDGYREYCRLVTENPRKLKKILDDEPALLRTDGNEAISCFEMK